MRVGGGAKRARMCNVVIEADDKQTRLASPPFPHWQDAKVAPGSMLACCWCRFGRTITQVLSSDGARDVGAPACRR